MMTGQIGVRVDVETDKKIEELMVLLNESKMRPVGKITKTVVVQMALKLGFGQLLEQLEEEARLVKIAKEHARTEERLKKAERKARKEVSKRRA